MRAIAAIMLFAVIEAGTPVAVPVYEEPHHALRLSNVHARVMDIRIPPAESTLYHTHTADLVGVSLADSPTRADVGGTEIYAQPDAVGQIWYEPFSKDPVTHQVTNTGTHAIQYIAAEVLAGSAEPTKAPVLNAPGHRLELENERILAFRVRLSGGEALESHVHSGPVLLIGLSGGTVRLAEQTGPQRIWQHSPGDFLWFEHDGPGAIANTGPEAFEAVEFEWR